MPCILRQEIAEKHRKSITGVEDPKKSNADQKTRRQPKKIRKKKKKT